ncbi:hypothetical protein [uncultured Thiodictyon sp.]|jgi:hypothetical protein|uniref:hypothetical protein n=1 Tax=uncultured Thiodictyon sp. TaxID=1846217 RepID=UPI0025DEB182|nr:hypothetical protein [uncultured Thiodictyon sp.]
MTAVKTETVTFRIQPEIKAALRQAAEHEHRSLANMLEVMIRDYRSRHAATATRQDLAGAGSPR